MKHDRRRKRLFTPAIVAMIILGVGAVGCGGSSSSGSGDQLSGQLRFSPHMAAKLAS